MQSMYARSAMPFAHGRGGVSIRFLGAETPPGSWSARAVGATREARAPQLWLSDEKSAEVAPAFAQWESGVEPHATAVTPTNRMQGRAADGFMRGWSAERHGWFARWPGSICRRMLLVKAAAHPHEA